jgi:hypothetical protein
MLRGSTIGAATLIDAAGAPPLERRGGRASLMSTSTRRGPSNVSGCRGVGNGPIAISCATNTAAMTTA